MTDGTASITGDGSTGAVVTIESTGTETGSGSTNAFVTIESTGTETGSGSTSAVTAIITQSDANIYGYGSIAAVSSQIHNTTVTLSVYVGFTSSFSKTWNAQASLSATAEFTISQNLEITSTASFSTSFDLFSLGDSTNEHPSLSVDASLSIDAEVIPGITSSSHPSFRISARGTLNREIKTIPIHSVPVGTVDNISDLPANPPDGTAYYVSGTNPNTQSVLAVYSVLTESWNFQSNRVVSTQIAYINPIIGTNVVMPNYLNFRGVPHVPKYWGTNIMGGRFAYTLEDIPPVSGAVGGSPTIWRWMVEDLAEPGSGKYSLNTWPAHGGDGPTWNSRSFYRPQVKGTVKFNIDKNQIMRQKSVTFNFAAVDHMWMECSDLPQPFTVIIAGIIHSYPTAKYGHYLLDSGKATPTFDANKTGKDFFFSEGAVPRNVMLFQKTRARIAVNTQPGADLKVCDLNIKTKHTEKARPRMFYGVFNEGASRIGTMDTKYKFDNTGELKNYGPSNYFVMGRRTNRVSDNRAAHMSIWDISIIHKALSFEEISGYYQEISNTYNFKEYG
jgi:hypothetical protein